MTSYTMVTTTIHDHDSPCHQHVTRHGPRHDRHSMPRNHHHHHHRQGEHSMARNTQCIIRHCHLSVTSNATSYVIETCVSNVASQATLLHNVQRINVPGHHYR